MNKITTAGNLPRPIQNIGLLTPQMNKAREELQAKLMLTNYDLAMTLSMPPEIWECKDVQELGTAAHLDECEIQVLRDRPNNRYYLSAMSVDPDRERGKITTTESGISLVEADSEPKPAMILYYTEITRTQFQTWQQVDTEKRLDAVRNEGRNVAP